MTTSNELPYLEFLGLTRNPFPVTPDADDFFESTDIDTIITELVHGITTRKGFFVLTGEVGVGKTTISRRILQLLTDADIRTSLVFHSLLPKLGLIKHINKDFGVPDNDADIDDELAKLSEFVLQENKLGNNCAIIIDDAQNLSWESLEMIRMISNLEGNSEKFVQILLIGQPELADKLNSKNLRQLKSRIVIQREITNLPQEGLQKYIDFKLTVAGPTRLETTSKVIKTIFKITNGNLRAVNILMDRCLYIAYAEQSQSLTVKMIKQAATDLKMTAAGSSSQKKVFIILLLILLSTGIASQLIDRTPIIIRKTDPLPTAQITAPLPVAEPESKPEQAVIPPAITTFLQGYNLQEYTDSFWQAVQNNNLTAIGEEIRKTTGLAMISLPVLPAGMQNLDALQVADTINQQPHFIFFWKPQLIINEYYYNYQGSRIVQLQYMLAEKDYYHGAIDGIVGRKLMQSVVDFQLAHNLTITGIPDQPTLFVLYSLTDHSASTP
jgi:general secretion pathway protein A